MADRSFANRFRSAVDNNDHPLRLPSFSSPTSSAPSTPDLLSRPEAPARFHASPSRYITPLHCPPILFSSCLPFSSQPTPLDTLPVIAAHLSIDLDPATRLTPEFPTLGTWRTDLRRPGLPARASSEEQTKRKHRQLSRNEGRGGVERGLA